MNSKRSKYIIFGLACLLFINTFLGCTYFSPVVGKWQDKQSHNTVEFTRDGKIIMDTNGYIVTGEYELVGNDVIKLSFQGLGGGMLSAFGADTYRYTISGDTMTLEGAGGTDTLYRFSDGINNTSINKDALFVADSIFVSSFVYEIDSEYAYVVVLKPTERTETFTNYSIEFYEQGEHKYSYPLVINSKINFNYMIYFPCSEQEYQKYSSGAGVKNLINVFSVEAKRLKEAFFVESISARPTDGDNYAYYVELKPRDLAKTDVSYQITLYENGQYRAASSFSTGTKLSSEYLVTFSCSADEYQKYGTQHEISNTFAVEIIQQ